VNPMLTHLYRSVLVLLVLGLFFPVEATAQESDDVPGIRTLPFREWLDEGVTEEINWDIDIDDAELRMDQRIDLTFSASVRVRDLEPRDVDHRLALWSWILDSEAAIQTHSGPIQYVVGSDVPRNAEIQFTKRLFVTPGEYTVSILLYDETTGQHNLARERVRVDEIDDEPFPEAFSGIPVAEFPITEQFGDLTEIEVTGDLVMPIRTRRPLEVELIAALSAPDNRSTERQRIRHTYNISRALTALSQLDPGRGSISISGLDLVRRKQLFDQRNVGELDSTGLLEAFAAANPPSISIDALAQRHLNPTFIKEFIEKQMAGRVIEGGTELSRIDTPLKVLILVTGFTLFDDDSNVSEVELEGRCDCRVYHIRMRQNLRDLFDDVDNILKPLYADTFNILTPQDLRDAMGEIVEDLERF
jgi:hypothetical protein